MNTLIQDEPVDAMDAETMGQLAAIVIVIVIVKGEPFAPDARMRRLLEEAAAVGHATARALLFHAPESEGVRYYPGSAWTAMIFPGGYLFETPPPLVTPEGITPFRLTGARKHNLRTLFFYGYTGITPAMCMRLTNIGSQYLAAFRDADDNYFDGARSYQVTLPPDIPAARFWSLTLYDNETRSMLQTPQRLPRGRQSALSDPGYRGQRRRVAHHPPGPRQAGRDRRWQLDPDRSRQGMVDTG